MEVAAERGIIKEAQCVGTRSGKNHLKGDWGEVWLALPTPAAFPATQSNKYLLSTTLPICPGPPSAKTLKSVQAAG